jgi:hypothetical protein
MAAGTNRRSHNDPIGALTGLFGVLPVVCSILAGGLVLLWQCVRWLEVAVWEPVTLRIALNWWVGHPTRPGPSTGWLGVDRILDWVVDQAPLPFLLIVVLPITWFFLVSAILNQVDKPVSPRRD